MILDERTEFGDALDLTLNTSNKLVGDVIDLGATPTLRDLGNGKPVYLVISVDTPATGAGNITLQLCSDSTANLATSKTVHVDTGAIAYTVYAAGYQKVYQLPVEATYERYLGLWLTTSGNLTACSVNAFLTLDPNGNRAYPDAL